VHDVLKQKFTRAIHISAERTVIELFFEVHYNILFIIKERLKKDQAESKLIITNCLAWPDDGLA